MINTWSKGILALALLSVAAYAGAATLRVKVAQYSKATGPYFNNVAKAFEQSHPDASVRIEVVPWSSLRQSLTTDIVARHAPDLSIIGTRWMPTLLSTNQLQPLGSLISTEFKNSFLPVFLKPETLHGKIYGLPIAASTRAMFYNKTLFKKAGIKHPPQTWKQLVADAKKIDALGEGTYGFGLQGGGVEAGVYFYYALWAHGGDIIQADGTSGLDTKAAYKAAKLYMHMIDSGLTQPGVTADARADLQKLFKQGKVGMIFTQYFLVQQLANQAPDLKYGIAKMPAGPEGQRGTYAVADSIVMFKSSQHKKLAMEFLETLFSEKWRMKWFHNEGFLPTTKPVAKVIASGNKYPRLAEFVDVVPDARFAPNISGWSEIAHITKAALQKIYGGAKIKPTFETAAQRINDIIKNGQ